MFKFFRVPFATSGDKTSVPDAADPSGNVSYTEGYGFDYQRQETDPDKKDIERDKMNALFFEFTTAIGELQSKGVPDFITTALNGGTPYSYSKNAIVRYSNVLYISLADTNTALPTDTTLWAPLPTPELIQRATYVAASAGGTANAITAAFAPAVTALPSAPAILSLLVRASAANTAVNPTFTPDGLAAKVIVKGNNLPLVPGDICGAGHWLHLVYDSALDRWVLTNPAQPIGNMVQRGSASVGGTGVLNLTFPKQFADTSYQLTITDRNASAWSPTLLTVYGHYNKTTGGVTVKAFQWNGSAWVAAVGDFDWIAIG